MGSLLLVRHAQASFGGPDYDVLSELGHRQTDALHASFEARGLTPTRFTAGAMRRQRDTALPWTRAGGELSIDARWDEYDSAAVLKAHGDVDASLERLPDEAPLSSRDFQAVLDPALERWIAAGAAGGAGESWQAFHDRVNSALEDSAAALGRGETAVVFTSAGAIAACVATVLGLPDAATVPLNRVAVNAAVTKVISGRRGLSVVSYNEHAHLEPDGLVTYR